MSEKQKGIIALVLVALAWGILPIFPRFLVQSFLLYQQLYLRIGAAFLFSCVFFYKKLTVQKIIHIPLTDVVLLVVRSACYWIIGAGAMTQALLSTSVSNVMFIQALPMTAILGILLLREQITWSTLLLVIASFIGVCIVSVNNVQGLFTFGFGELLSFISIVAFSVSLVARKWHTDFLSDKEISTYTLFIAGLFVYITSWIVGEGVPVWNGDGKLLGIVFVSGLIIAGMNYFLMYGFKRVEAIIANPILSLETVLSILFAFLVFHETPNANAYIGGALILFSALAMHWLEFQKKT
jgi:drug/metabolite transporter (DMT)-like permease